MTLLKFAMDALEATQHELATASHCEHGLEECVYCNGELVRTDYVVRWADGRFPNMLTFTVEAGARYFFEEQRRIGIDVRLVKRDIFEITIGD